MIQLGFKFRQFPNSAILSIASIASWVYGVYSVDLIPFFFYFWGKPKLAKYFTIRKCEIFLKLKEYFAYVVLPFIINSNDFIHY